MRRLSALALGLMILLLPVPFGYTKTASSGEQANSTSAVQNGNTETWSSGDSVVQSDRTGKGAVLCSWEIYQAIQAVGSECHKGEDTAFQNELKKSLDRIDHFIIANSKHPVTSADLDARRVAGIQQLRSSSNICVGDAARMYEAIRGRGATALNTQTTDLLSIPREPVLNPCL